MTDKRDGVEWAIIAMHRAVNEHYPGTPEYERAWDRLERAIDRQLNKMEGSN